MVEGYIGKTERKMETEAETVTGRGQEKKRVERQGKMRAGESHGRPNAIPSDVRSEGFRLRLQGRGRQPFEPQVLGDELPVHLVAQVAQLDRLQQPDTFHSTQAGQLHVDGAVPRVDSVPPPGVVFSGQVQHRIPVGGALGFVFGHSEGRSHRDLVPLDPHVLHLHGEGGGEHRDAIPLEVREGLVLDLFPLEQDAQGGVAAEDGVVVVAPVSRCVGLAEEQRTV